MENGVTATEGAHTQYCSVEETDRFTYTHIQRLSSPCCLCCRLMSSGSLRKLLAGWNEVCQLAERMERSQLEVLDLQHNHLTELPHNLFIKAQRCALLFFFFSYLFFPYAFHLVFFHVCFHLYIFIFFLFPSVSFIFCQIICSSLYSLSIFHHSLRYLNVSANKLENLPAASLSDDSSSRLEELYVTNNSLSDKCVPLLTGHGNLRVLHIAYNQLQTFTAR